MSTTPSRYRKKPVEIEAMRYDGTPTTCLPIHNWLGIEHRDTGAGCAAGILIDTLEGQMHVNVGDYVIRGVQGEFYPCKPNIFAATYENASTAQEPTDAEIDAAALEEGTLTVLREGGIPLDQYEAVREHLARTRDTRPEAWDEGRDMARRILTAAQQARDTGRADA